MKEETIIQILNSLTTVGEKSLDDLIAMVFFEIFIIFIFYFFISYFQNIGIKMIYCLS